MFEVKYFVAIIVLIWIYVLWSRRKFYLLCTKIPGPLGLPIIGIYLRLAKREDILYTMKSIRLDYGKTFYSWLGTFPFLVVSDPKIVEKILTSPHLLNKSKIYGAVEECIGNGLFCLQSTEWKHHRKHLNKAFTHKVLISFFPIFDREINRLNNKLETLIGKGEFDVTDMLQTLSFNIAGETTMGKPMADIEMTYKDIFSNFQFNLEVVTNKLFAPWFQNKAIFKLTSQYEKYEKTKGELVDFINSLIADKVKEQNDNKLKSNLIESNVTDDVGISKTPNIFIDHAIDLVRSGHFNWKEVENEAGTIMFGAFETTANTLGNVLICLAMFPEYQEKVFEEILENFPEKDFVVKYEDIQKLVYTEMVINETMRVLAPVPLIARTVSEDVMLFDGIVLPKGLQVAIDIFNMHRDEDIWGPRACTFDPNHFLPENLANKHPFAFMPFTKGTRVCIGMKYSMMSMKASLIKILRKYRLSSSFNFKDLQFMEGITIKFSNTPKIEIHHRTR